MKEEIVYIRRRQSKKLAKNKDLKLMDDNASKYMGAAGYKGTSLPITGLTEAEKFFIMPQLVQIANTHNEFDLSVNEYFHDLRVEVPAGKGLKLNIATETVEKVFAGEKIKIEMPVKPLDYVLYKRAVHSEYKQCTTAEDKSSGDRAKFYVHDVAKAAKLEEVLGEAHDDAYDAYLKISDKPEKWDNILLVFGFNPDLLSKVEKKKRLRLLATADGIVGHEDQLKQFQKFKNLVGDTDLDIKGKIKELINAKILLVEGTSYIYNNGKTSVTIAKSEDGAIAWMKDQDNSFDVLTMEATLEKLKG